MKMRLPPPDPNYAVDGLPPSIKGKITELVDASIEYAFKGTAQDPKDYEAIIEAFRVARHDLERTIMTKLKQTKT